jgi:hypothetical protein
VHYLEKKYDRRLPKPYAPGAVAALIVGPDYSGEWAL